MGCASSVNVQIEEGKENRKVLANGKEVGNIKKSNNNEKIEERSEENKDEDYLEMPSIKQSKNENTDSKTFNTNANTNIKKIDIKNIKINNYNQSTNFKYLKDNKINLIKSNPIIKDNKNEQDLNQYQYKFIPLRHPLDSSLDKNYSDLKNINISEEKEKEKENNNENYIKENINDNINGNVEEKINIDNEINNNGDDNDDAVNIGNYYGGEGDGDNDDMCNFGQSMDFDNKNNKNKNKNENESKEICVVFEIQSTGVKYNINVNENVKLIELIELFKKKIKLSSFEKPEFVFNSVFLVDFEKPISDYKIEDKSKINVFI